MYCEVNDISRAVNGQGILRMRNDNRWKQRFENFERAFSLLKEAFAAKIVKDGQTWIDMLEHRNLMTHTYDSETFEAAFGSISQKYLTALEQVFEWLKEKEQQ